MTSAEQNSSDELKAEVLFAFQAEESNELTVSVGDIVQVLKQGDDGWSECKFRNKIGLLPSNYIKIIGGPQKKKMPPIPPPRAKSFNPQNTVKLQIPTIITPEQQRATMKPQSSLNTPTVHNLEEVPLSGTKKRRTSKFANLFKRKTKDEKPKEEKVQLIKITRRKSDDGVIEKEMPDPDEVERRFVVI